MTNEAPVEKLKRLVKESEELRETFNEAFGNTIRMQEAVLTELEHSND
jgi:hypothetical protein